MESNQLTFHQFNTNKRKEKDNLNGIKKENKREGKLKPGVTNSIDMDWTRVKDTGNIRC